MKKIIFFICFFFLFSLPLVVLAYEDNQVQVPPIYIQRSALPAADAPPVNFPVGFTINGSSGELQEIKMVKLSVQSICLGTIAYNLQAGDFRPEADDYKDGKIEGSLNYQPTQNNSCLGKRNIILYFCSQADNNCLVTLKQQGILIDKVQKDGVIEIGDNPPDDVNPPDDQNPPDGINPPVEPGDGNEDIYDPLLPGEGKFLTIWDLLARVVQIMLALAGVVAVGAIVIGGYQYMSSAGIPDKAQMAKSTITYAIIGLVLIMIMYAAMRFLLPALGVSQDVIWF